jgi:hypothetical protein
MGGWPFCPFPKTRLVSNPLTVLDYWNRVMKECYRERVQDHCRLSDICLER